MANRQKEMQWVGRIRAALEDNRFQLYYQPIVTLSDDRQERIHYELLIRLRDEDNVLVPPMAFIPSAERYNLMPEIDRWVIHTALQHFGNLCPDQDGVCAINLSGASLSGGQLLPFIREQLACFAVPPSQLCFEITETVAIGNLSDAIKLVTELKAIGCRFALDDFGSGMSSFAYLKHLHIDYLKIDGAFVKNMLNDSVDLAMVNSINDIGHIMGIKTIAEFVENEQICERLKAMKVDFAQGYGIAKPAPCLYLEQW
jgi:EAL domain-containing protein (putative c-di-GMP-specific phosphodiesterase class I)